MKYKVLEGYDELCERLRLPKPKVKDERRLCYSDAVPIMKTLSTNKILGKCFVRHFNDISDLSAFKDQSINHFYLVDTLRNIHNKALRRHVRTTSMELKENTKVYNEDLKVPKEPLRGLSLFTGGGGIEYEFLY